MNYIVAILITVTFLFASNSYSQSYTISSQKCYSTSKVPSLSSNDICLGLVADTNLIKWKLPRKIIFIDKEAPEQKPEKNISKDETTLSTSTAIVTAIGGWQKNLGQVWKLNLNQGNLISSELLFQNTDRTHGLAIGPNRWIYYADSTKIYRFRINNPSLSREVAISDLPDSYTDRNNQTSSSSHPLKEIIFLDNWDMVVNVGAPSNDCSEEFKSFRACHQRDQQAELRKYKYNPLNDSYSGDYEVIARGLRNSMGLLYNPKTQRIYQAENASDQLGTPDELNIVNPMLLALDQDFGWPFCFGDQKTYVGYTRFVNFCNNTSLPPYIILPAHAAPLDIKYYQGMMFKKLKNTILMSWHGHRPSGSKIAVYETDMNLAPSPKHSITSSNQPLPPLQLLSSRWEKAEAGHPKGRPVGIAFDDKGAIFVIDDVNNSLLVLASNDSSSSQTSEPVIPAPIDYVENDLTGLFSPNQIQKWPQVFSRLNNLSCQNCHSEVFSSDPTKTLLNLVNNKWVNPNSKNLEDQLIWIRLLGFNGAKIMPPAPNQNIFNNPADITIVESWLKDIN